MRYQPQYQVPHTRDALARTTGFPTTDPGRGYLSPSRANALRQPGMPILGTAHHQKVFGKHTGSIMMAHSVPAPDTEKDQEFFRETSDRTINVVETLGDQNRHLADQCIQLKQQLRLATEKMKSDDAEVARCQEEINRHVTAIDNLEHQNDEMSKALNEEREAHRVTTQKLEQTSRELDQVSEELRELRTTVVADLEARNAALQEEARREKNNATTLAQRVSASEARCHDLTNQCQKLQRSNEELCKDSNLLLKEKEDLKETLAREQAAFEEGINIDRANAQMELNKICSNLRAQLEQQSSAFRVLHDEYAEFKDHSHQTSDQYHAFHAAQNDEIQRLQELSEAQAVTIEQLFESAMATRTKMEQIENTVYTTEARIGLSRNRSPVRNRLSDARLHNKFQ